MPNKALNVGTVVIVDEGYSMCGIGGEIAATVVEQAFDALDTPIGRLHPAPVTHPFAPSLENEILITAEKNQPAVHAVIAGTPLIPRRLTAQNVACEQAPALYHPS